MSSRDLGSSIYETHNHTHVHNHYGIDLTDPKQARMYAAIQIMAGAMADPERNGSVEAYAQDAVKATDALFAELEKDHE